MANLPLRSKLPWSGSNYAPALGAHWGDQTPDVYKKRWQEVVLDKDKGGIKFTQNYRWPTVYYMKYDDTYSQGPDPVRQADKLFGDSDDMYSPPTLALTPIPRGC